MIQEAKIEDLPDMEAGARVFYAASRFLSGFDPERFRELWTRLITAGIGVIFTFSQNGRIRGAIGGVVYPDTYSDRQVATEFFWFVEPGFRGRGLALYREFEAWAKRKECREIRMVHLLDLMPDKLERVYRHFGFEPVEVHYRKELEP